MSAASLLFHNDLTTLGIVSFEFAGTSGAAQAFLQSWDVDQSLAVVRHTRFDFLYLIAYGLLAALLCETISRRISARRWARAGVFLAWSACFAALFDAFENIGMLWILDHGSGQPWPALVALMAAIKFSLIVPALLYLFAALFYLLLRRLQGVQA